MGQPQDVDNPLSGRITLGVGWRIIDEGYRHGQHLWLLSDGSTPQEQLEDALDDVREEYARPIRAARWAPFTRRAMQIQPLFMTLNTLLNGRLFRIPEYQRAYSWGTKQREDLFTDVRKLKGTDKGHFMATMVGLRRRTVKIAADAFTELEVVDGQQRLTTIALLLRALQKALATGAAGDQKLATEIHDLLVKGDDLNLLLLQTNHDSSHIFVDYVRDGRIAEQTAVQTSADQNLIKAIDECEAFVRGWQKNGTTVELLGILRNQLSVIFHEISDESLVYTVFEVLNSRGLDVTWFDKVKAMLMAIVFENGDDGGKKTTIEELHRIWKDIYRLIGTRQTLNRETLRFAATLNARQQPSRPLSEEDAAAEIVAQCGTSAKKALEQSRWLLRVCEAEARLLGNHRLRAVTQIVQARLAAIAIMLRKFTPAEEGDLLQTWENVTFQIYGLAGRDARTAVGDYVRLSWSMLNDKIAANKAKSELTAIATNIISLNEAIDGLRGIDMYPGRAEVLRYFLYRYDEHLAREAGHKLNESQWNKIWSDEPAKSIEHIKPQSSGVGYVHRLGNLTMLPPGVNSKLKNIEPRSKADTYLTSGLMGAARVGRELEKITWSATTVQEREDALLAWAAQTWKS